MSDSDNSYQALRFRRNFKIVHDMLNLGFTRDKHNIPETVASARTIGRWFDEKDTSVPHRSVANRLEKFLNIKKDTLLNKETTWVRDELKKLSCDLFDIQDSNKGLAGSYVMVRWAFSRTNGQEKEKPPAGLKNLILSRINILSFGDEVRFYCKEPKYPFTGKCIDRGNNISLIADSSHTEEARKFYSITDEFDVKNFMVNIFLDTSEARDPLGSLIKYNAFPSIILGTEGRTGSSRLCSNIGIVIDTNYFEQITGLESEPRSLIYSRDDEMFTNTDSREKFLAEKPINALNQVKLLDKPKDSDSKKEFSVGQYLSKHDSKSGPCITTSMTPL